MAIIRFEFAGKTFFNVRIIERTNAVDHG